jgi:hypothetical protein
MRQTWRQRPYGVRGGGGRGYGPGSRWENDDRDGGDRSWRLRWIERLRDRLMLRQHWLDQALARLDALEESDGTRVLGAPFYTLGGLAQGIARSKYERSDQSERERRMEERHRRAREREARDEQGYPTRRSERGRSEYDREADDQDVTSDREEADEDYDEEASGPTPETDYPPEGSADAGTPARGRGTSKKRSPRSQTSERNRARGGSRRRS